MGVLEAVPRAVAWLHEAAVRVLSQSAWRRASGGEQERYLYMNLFDILGGEDVGFGASAFLSVALSGDGRQRPPAPLCLLLIESISFEAWRLIFAAC